MPPSLTPIARRGRTLDVDPDTADQWETAGWVDRVKRTTTKKPT